MTTGIDWMLAATIAAPILTLFIGIALDRILERKPKLIAYYGHASVFRLLVGNNPTIIHAHSVVVKNTGRKPAEHIQISHNYLPDISVFPDMEYTTVNLPGRGAEIRIPK